MGIQNGHTVPFLEPISLKKRKRKAMSRIKQIDKMLNIEKFCLLRVLKKKLRSFVGTSPDHLLRPEGISPAAVHTLPLLTEQPEFSNSPNNLREPKGDRNVKRASRIILPRLPQDDKDNARIVDLPREMWLLHLPAQI